MENIGFYALCLWVAIGIAGGILNCAARRERKTADKDNVAFALRNAKRKLERYTDKYSIPSEAVENEIDYLASLPSKDFINDEVREFIQFWRLEYLQNKDSE